MKIDESCSNCKKKLNDTTQIGRADYMCRDGQSFEELSLESESVLFAEGRVRGIRCKNKICKEAR